MWTRSRKRPAEDSRCEMLIGGARLREEPVYTARPIDEVDFAWPSLLT